MSSRAEQKVQSFPVAVEYAVESEMKGVEKVVEEHVLCPHLYLCFRGHKVGVNFDVVLKDKLRNELEWEKIQHDEE